MSVASALKIQRAINARRAERRFGALSTLTAADFLTGGAPTAAEVYDRKGARLAAFARQEEERSFAAFRERVREAARALPGAARVKLGGLARGPSAGFAWPAGERPQRRGRPARDPAACVAARGARAHRRQPTRRAGRRPPMGQNGTVWSRWRSTAALAGRSVGLFAPTYQASWSPLIERDRAGARASCPACTINRALGEIRLARRRRRRRSGRSITPGAPVAAGNITCALIDEAAHDEGYLEPTRFPAAIAPALLDYAGSVVAASTPNGLEGCVLARSCN